jgi:hypothetical protein
LCEKDKILPKISSSTIIEVNTEEIKKPELLIKENNMKIRRNEGIK